MVSERTSQFCATICIHVPMLDVQAPNHWTRKSRYVNAASMRRIVRAPSDEDGAAAVSAGRGRFSVGGFGQEVLNAALGLRLGATAILPHGQPLIGL